MEITARLEDKVLHLPFDEIAYDKSLNKMSIRYKGKIINEVQFQAPDAFDIISICNLNGSIEFKIDMENPDDII